MNERSETDIEGCSACGGELQHGYLIGKHNRIRWSLSPKGVTIFHGVPLMRREQGFRRLWRQMLYAPNIKAARCLKCQIVVFRYNNTAQETPRNEWLASMILGGILMATSIFLVILTWGVSNLASKMPLFGGLLIGLVAVTVFLMGGLCLAHAIRIWRANKRLHADVGKPRT